MIVNELLLSILISFLSSSHRAVVEALSVLRPRVNIILKSGTEWQIMLDMDDHTFARHFRISKTRFEVLKGYLQEGGLQSDHNHGLPPPAYCQEGTHVPVVHGQPELLPGDIRQV